VVFYLIHYAKRRYSAPIWLSSTGCCWISCVCHRWAEHSISVWERSAKYLGTPEGHQTNPNVNDFVREPGHIEYAANLGLGVYERDKIKVSNIEV
jgi:hypothetical protein